MTKSETDNLKEEFHAPAKYFESKSACWDVDISQLSKAELVLIVEKLPQRGKKPGVMSLSAKGDVVFVCNSGQDLFFRRTNIGDMWSFVHKRLLLIIALANDRNSHDLHFFSMHRRRGVDLVFKLRKMVSEERLEMMRTVRNQEKFASQLKRLQNRQESEARPTPVEQNLGEDPEVFADDDSKRSETSGAFLSPPRSASPAGLSEELLSRTPSLPPSASQCSADSGGSWFDILSSIRLDPPPNDFQAARNQRQRSRDSFLSSSTAESGRNPFREISGNSSEYQITNPFILSAVLNCFHHGYSPFDFSNSIRAR